MAKIVIQDEAVIYYSREDSCYIAHSLRMDQIGAGDSIVDALADVLKAAAQVIRLAERNESIAYLREAPTDVQALFQKAKPLPREIYEIAYKKAHGEWPQEWGAVPLVEDKEPFKTQILEPCA